MPLKEFWYDDPRLLWAYRKSYIANIKINKEISNYNAWLNGAYFFDAITKSIYNSFGRKSGQPILNYIEKPYEFGKSKEETEKEERLKVEEQIKARNQEIKEILQRRKEKGQITT